MCGQLSLRVLVRSPSFFLSSGFITPRYHLVSVLPEPGVPSRAYANNLPVQLVFFIFFLFIEFGKETKLHLDGITDSEIEARLTDLIFKQHAAPAPKN